MGRPKVIRMKTCATCGKEFDAGTRKGKLNCSSECLDRYKLEHKEERMSKSFEAIKEKYGVSNFFETKDFHKKAKKKKEERYGDENYNNHDKIKETLRERYGVEHPSQTEGYSEKTKVSKKEKYGDENFNNREKAKQTNIENLGVDHHLKTEESLNRLKETNLKKYNVECPLQLEKSRKSLIVKNRKKFGSDYFFSSKEHLSKTRDAKIEKIKRIVSQGNLSFNSDKYEKMRIKTSSGSLHYVKYHLSCNSCGNEFDCSFDSSPICRKCYPLTSASKQQDELKSFLTECRADFVEGTRSIIPPLELDFYLPGQNMAIELNGNYFHSEIGGEKDSCYHLGKSVMCQEKGIKLIHIFEDEWMFKREIIKSRIANNFGSIQKKLHARKCIIREVEHAQRVEFLRDNHMQGADVCSVAYGLWCKTDSIDEYQLVSIMSFSKPRLALGVRGNSGAYGKSMELSRFCSRAGFNVIGAFEKLLNHFTKHNSGVDSVYSYADCRWSGMDPKKTVYAKCGFTYLHTSRPSYFYVNRKDYINRVHRFRYNKKSLLQEFNGNPKKTEWELAKEAGFDRIWDCGSMKFELKLDKGIS